MFQLKNIGVQIFQLKETRVHIGCFMFSQQRRSTVKKTRVQYTPVKKGKKKTVENSCISLADM
jgi:hypothetical protein